MRGSVDTPLVEHGWGSQHGRGLGEEQLKGLPRCVTFTEVVAALAGAVMVAAILMSPEGRLGQSAE